jgi:tRNA(Ile)-lysidine synthase
MAGPLAAGGSPLPDLPPQVAINRFLNALHRPMRLLVAVSGGSDSIGLLIGLDNALRTQRFGHAHSLLAATVDHGLRPASREEALEVGNLCHRLGIPHRIQNWEGAKPKTGLSAAARDARYRLLAEAAHAFEADAIVTGHTQDDQIETVIMRASRSPEGAIGLAGMAEATLYENRWWILRPFLDTRRAAIRDMLSSQGQRWIDDPSNEDPHYERVRTRKAGQTIDPARIAEAGRNRQRLSLAAAGWLADHAEARPGPVVLLTGCTAPPPRPDIRDHALSTLLAVLGGKTHRPSADSLYRLTSRLEMEGDFRMTLSGTLVLRRRDTLYMVRERRGLLPLPLPPGRRAVWDGRYEIHNSGDTEVTIVPGPASIISPDLPVPVRTAMSGNAPKVLYSTALSADQTSAVTVQPRLSLFAGFMPVFDQALADAICRLVGRELTPLSPI